MTSKTARMETLITKPVISFSYALAPTETQIRVVGILEIPYTRNNLGAFTGVSPATYIMISLGIRGIQQNKNRLTVPVVEFKIPFIFSIFFMENNLETSSYPKKREI